MNELNDKLIERVRQLLAMAADTSSPAEASIAAGRARKLMDQHQITLEHLKESNGFGFKRAGKSYRFMPKWKDILAVAVGTFNDCKVIAQHEYMTVNKSYSKHIVFQGFEADVACAVFMYEYLCEAVDRMCQTYIAELGYSRYPAVIGDAHKKAASNEICARLRAMTEERKTDLLQNNVPGTSLVLFKMAEVEAEFGKVKYVTKSMTNSRKPNRQDEIAQANVRGRKDGQEVSLNRQVS